VSQPVKCPPKIAFYCIAVVTLGLLFTSGFWIVKSNRIKTNAPVLRFKNKVWHAGVIDELGNNTVQHTFTFKNVGDKHLEIHDIRAGCSCMIASIESLKRSYAPGESGAIIAALSFAVPGPKSDHILIFSNAPSSPDKLFVDGLFRPTTYAQAVPQQLYMHKAVNSIPVSKKVTIEVLSLDDEDINIVDIESSSQAVLAKIVGVSRSNVRSDRGYFNYSFHISVSPNRKRLGPFKDKLKVIFEPNNISLIEIPVEGTIIDKWICKPSKAILVWSSLRKQLPERIITIDNLEGHPFLLNGIANPLPEWLKINVNSASDEKKVTLTVTSHHRPKKKHVKGVIKLSVRTKGGEDETIEIPFTIIDVEDNTDSPATTKYLEPELSGRT